MTSTYVKTKFGRCRYSIEKDYAHIYNLYVFPEFRHQGKARELLQQAIKKIKDSGWNEEIQIVADPREEGIDKEKLILFYESMGLKVFECYA